MTHKFYDLNGNADKIIHYKELNSFQTKIILSLNKNFYFIEVFIIASLYM